MHVKRQTGLPCRLKNYVGVPHNIRRDTVIILLNRRT